MTLTATPLDIFNYTCMSLSFIGIIAIYVSAVVLQTYTSKFSQSILFLCFADFCYCLPLQLIFKNDHTTCKIIDLIQEYFLVSSFFWSISLAYVLKVVLSERSLEFVNKYFQRFIFVCQGAPIIFCGCLFLFYSEYDPSADSCERKSKIGLGYLASVAIPFLLTVIFSIYSYITSVKLIRELYGDVYNRINGFMTFFMNPVILIICWGPSTIMMIVDEFNPTSDNLDLFNWLRTWGKLQGLFNAIAYALNHRMVDSCKKRCRKEKDKSVFDNFSFSLNEINTRMQETFLMNISH